MNNLQRKRLMLGLRSGQVAVLRRDTRLLYAYFDAVQGYVLVSLPFCSVWAWDASLPGPAVFQHSSFAVIFALMVDCAPASKWKFSHVYRAV